MLEQADKIDCRQFVTAKVTMIYFRYLWITLDTFRLP